MQPKKKRKQILVFEASTSHQQSLEKKEEKISTQTEKKEFNTGRSEEEM